MFCWLRRDIDDRMDAAGTQAGQGSGEGFCRNGIVVGRKIGSSQIQIFVADSPRGALPLFLTVEMASKLA